MRLFIDFINALHEVELMKIAVHDHLRKELGGDEVVATSDIIQYVPKDAERDLIYFRMDYRTHGQSASTLANVARASFTNAQIMNMINSARGEA